ncbi:MAG: carboxynorspermidine decarboxylase, partial [Prevotella sp.]|nr:carboxynorspermidine decarboxylase [Prevotella sp.]
RFHRRVREADHRVSMGLRINPEYSEIATDLYNPCAPGTRFGITADKLPEQLPGDIDGFHCHCHCESSADEFERTLSHIEEKFSRWFPQLKWINFGGGHLMTRKNYDVALLVRLLKNFKRRHPNLHVILEPGSAFAWQTGPLVAKIVDIVADKGIRTAILNVSFTCHMPDCLEMPYMPEVRNATQHPTITTHHPYRLGGNSCLSGDFLGDWAFDHELQVGETIIFEDMIHYTTVKTTMFNGISHPSIGILRLDNELEILRKFTYEDYRDRMD